MQCEICGATIPAGATTCPACGAAVAAAAQDKPVARKQSKPRRRTWLVVVAAILALTVVGVGGWIILTQMQANSGPDGAAIRMMTAFANYDGQGILDNATHASLTATDEATFLQQARDGKNQNKGLPAVKDIAVTSVKYANASIASKDATTATVQLTAKWLTDPEKGTYTERNEILTVVREGGKPGGKWLVRLFQ